MFFSNFTFLAFCSLFLPCIFPKVLLAKFAWICTNSEDLECLCLQELHKYVEQEKEYQLLYMFMLKGFVVKQPRICMHYWNTHLQLALDDDLAVARLLIPTKMCHQVLTNLYEAHQRALRAQQLAHLTICWIMISIRKRLWHEWLYYKVNIECPLEYLLV